MSPMGGNVRSMANDLMADLSQQKAGGNQMRLPMGDNVIRFPEEVARPAFIAGHLEAAAAALARSESAAQRFRALLERAGPIHSAPPSPQESPHRALGGRRS